MTSGSAADALSMLSRAAACCAIASPAGSKEHDAGSPGLGRLSTNTSLCCSSNTSLCCSSRVSAFRWVGWWGLWLRVYHLSQSHPKAFLIASTCSCRSGSTAKHQSVAPRTVCFSFFDRNLAFNSNLLSFVMPANYTTAHAHTHMQHTRFCSSQPT
jgi:hypothetical protein